MELTVANVVLSLLIAALTTLAVAVAHKTRSLSRKYRRAVALRGDRTTPLSKLRRKPKGAEPSGRYLKDGPQTPIECFTDALGLNIMVYSWPPTGAYKGKAPKAVILYCHGLDCCAEVDLAIKGNIGQRLGYVGSWWEVLNEAGYLVYGWDYNGMGHSESVVDGVRSAIFDYGDYVDEAMQLRQLLGARHPSLPFVMLGGSMGACVGLNALQADPTQYDASIFFCPAVSFEKLKKKGLNKCRRPEPRTARRPLPPAHRACASVRRPPP